MELHVDYIKAGNQNSTPECLRVLARSSEKIILRRLAKNASTPIDVLCDLKDHADSVVRSNVACNPSTPPHLVRRFAEDPSTDVRFHMAGDPNLSLEILSQLALDDHPSVRERARRTLDGASLEWELQQSGFEMVPGTHGRLGELLVVAGVLEFHQIDDLLHEVKSLGTPLGRALVQSGLASQATVSQALKCQTLIRTGHMTVKAAIEIIRTAARITTDKFKCERSCCASLDTVSSARA